MRSRRSQRTWNEDRLVPRRTDRRRLAHRSRRQKPRRAIHGAVFLIAYTMPAAIVTVIARSQLVFVRCRLFASGGKLFGISVGNRQRDAIISTVTQRPKWTQGFFSICKPLIPPP